MRFVCLWSPDPGGTTMLSAPTGAESRPGGVGREFGVCRAFLLARHRPGTQAAVTLQSSEPECVSCSHLELIFYLLEVTARVASTSVRREALVGPFSGMHNSRKKPCSGSGASAPRGPRGRQPGPEARMPGGQVPTPRTSSPLLGQIHRPHSLPAYLGHMTPFSPASKRHCLWLSLGHVLLKARSPACCSVLSAPPSPRTHTSVFLPGLLCPL